MHIYFTDIVSRHARKPDARLPQVIIIKKKKKKSGGRGGERSVSFQTILVLFVLL